VLGQATTLASAEPFRPDRFGDALRTGQDVLHAMASAEGGVWKIEEVAPS
jgi:hypothetical protein